MGLFIPMRFYEHLDIKPGDELDVMATEEKIEIVPIRNRAHRTKFLTIEELFEGYEGTCQPPTDWGEPIGRELW